MSGPQIQFSKDTKMVLNSALQKFSDFANESIKGDPIHDRSHVSRVIFDGNGGTKIIESNTDFRYNLSRSKADKSMNNRARWQFYQAIVAQFGGANNIPAEVKKAMKINDFGNISSTTDMYNYEKHGTGKPLEAWRIRDVINAIAKVIKSDSKLFADNIVKNLKAFASSSLPQNMKETLFNDYLNRIYDQVFPMTAFKDTKIALVQKNTTKASIAEIAKQASKPGDDKEWLQLLYNVFEASIACCKLKLKQSEQNWYTGLDDRLRNVCEEYDTYKADIEKEHDIIVVREDVFARLANEVKGNHRRIDQLVDNFSILLVNSIEDNLVDRETTFADGINKNDIKAKLDSIKASQTENNVKNATNEAEFAAAMKELYKHYKNEFLPMFATGTSRKCQLEIFLKAFFKGYTDEPVAENPQNAENLMPPVGNLLEEEIDAGTQTFKDIISLEASAKSGAEREQKITDVLRKYVATAFGGNTRLQEYIKHNRASQKRWNEFEDVGKLLVNRNNRSDFTKGIARTRDLFTYFQSKVDNPPQKEVFEDMNAKFYQQYTNFKNSAVLTFTAAERVEIYADRLERNIKNPKNIERFLRNYFNDAFGENALDNNIGDRLHQIVTDLTTNDGDKFDTALNDLKNCYENRYKQVAPEGRRSDSRIILRRLIERLQADKGMLMMELNSVNQDREIVTSFATLINMRLEGREDEFINGKPEKEEDLKEDVKEDLKEDVKEDLKEDVKKDVKEYNRLLIEDESDEEDENGEFEFNPKKKIKKTVDIKAPLIEDDVPGAISVNSSKADTHHFEFDGDWLPVYDNEDEVDTEKGMELFNEKALEKKFNEIMETVGKYAAKFGGAPNFGEKMPRAQAIPDDMNAEQLSLHGMTTQTWGVYADSMRDRGGIFKAFGNVVAAVTDATTGRTTFEKAEIFLDGVRRLAGNINYILAIYGATTSENGSKMVSLITGIGVHPDNGGDSIQRDVITQALMRVLLNVQLAYDDAKEYMDRHNGDPKEMYEFIEKCSQLVCFQDVISKMEDYLSKKGLLANSVETYRENAQSRQAHKEKVSQFETDKDNGMIVVHPDILDKLRGRYSDNLTLDEAIDFEIRALYTSYRDKDDNPERVFTKKEIMDFLKQRFAVEQGKKQNPPKKKPSNAKTSAAASDRPVKKIPRNDAPQPRQAPRQQLTQEQIEYRNKLAKNLYFVVRDENEYDITKAEIKERIFYEDKNTFWDRVSEILDTNYVKTNDAPEYRRGVTTQGIRQVFFKGKLEPYNAAKHGPADNLNDGVRVINRGPITDRTRPNPNGDIEYKKGAVRAIFEQTFEE